MIVNKTHPITPSDFRPDIAIVRGYQVATAAAGPLGRLLDASDQRGLGFKIASAFRSYDYQRQVHDQVEAASGATQADLVSARAGYSEHQTGLAVDLVTPADPRLRLRGVLRAVRREAGGWRTARGGSASWSATSRRRPPSPDTQPEPWHLRYVGKPLARELRREGIATLEEFFGVPGGDYPG